MCSEAGFLAYVTEFPIAFIVIKNMSHALERIRMAIAPLLDLLWAAQGIVAEIPVKVSRDNQIKAAIAVVIQKRRTAGPTSGRDPGLLSYILEFPIALVVIKLIAAEISHVDVRPAVVIVIRDRDTHAEPLSAEAGTLGNVHEGSEAAIAIEPVPVTRMRFIR